MWRNGLPQMEPDLAGKITRPASLIDLRQVEQGQRRLMWDEAARSSWPGISVRLTTMLPSGGLIRRIPLGSGDLFEVESVPAEVDFRPVPVPGVRDAFISVMVQAEGVTTVRQGGHSSSVCQGDVCLLDEAGVFKLMAEEWGRIYFLRLPRAQVLGRYPQLERMFAHALPSSETGTRLLADLLLRLFEDAPLLADAQRRAMLGGIIQMLGVANPPDEAAAAIDWRIRRALDFIELHLSVPGLSAEDVAREQRISRRRLDQIMQQQLGQSIAGYLWSRRLAQAADDLRDPQRCEEPIAQIAFANGFEDAAHFTRAFKRRYAVTPGQWRLQRPAKPGSCPSKSSRGSKKG